MTLPPAQHTTLCYMLDQEWHLGAAIARTGGTLSALDKAGFIRSAGEDEGYMRDMWTITQDGLDAVKA